MQLKLCGFLTVASLVLNLFLGNAANAQVDAVKLEKGPDSGFTLQRDEKPFFILGAGGDASKELLKKSGGNSFRTWGSDQLDQQLAEAHRLGLTVAAGIWLQHQSGGWQYKNPQQVAEQFERAKQAILKYKDSPAVLIWGLGNEMEGYEDGGDPAIWNAVEAIAKFAHQVDPNHPTMTVVAEIGGKRVAAINQYCPDIDIIGINSYGGGPTLAKRYRDAGGVKPFVVTEFGPPGSWESPATAWGARVEMTSTAKGDYYRRTYESTISAERGKLCLGSYAFAWGNKREASATWYGIFQADGSRLEALDQLSQLWTEQPLVKHCPQIEPLKASRDRVKPGEVIHVDLRVTDPMARPLTVQWVLERDPQAYSTAGETQAEPPTYPEAISNGDLHGCDLKMPPGGASYRLYAYVSDQAGDSAMANIPLKVDGPPAKFIGQSVELPFVLYGDDDAATPYAASGWMGKTSAIQLDPRCTESPKSGKYCLKCEFNSADNFAGVAWQSPANDWGNQPGGFNLTGAKKLTFWARGQSGDEVVSFSVGLLGKDKKYPDSDVSRLTDQKLTRDWVQYSIDLTGKDLSDIKTGFCWTAAAHGKPMVFYLADAKFE